MVDNNDVFLRELKQEIEREKFAQIWQRYGLIIIGGAVAILAGVVAYQGWYAYTMSAAQEAGAKYEVALEQATTNKLDEAVKGFESVLETGSRGYSTLAELQLAATHLEMGKKDEALATYEKLAKDTGADTLLRDFARLQAAAIQLGTADWTEMENRLTDLTSSGNAWRHSARELLGLAALRAGKTNEARELFGKVLSDPEAPANVKERARLTMERIVAEDLKVAPQAPAPADASDAAAEVKTDDAPSAVDGEAKVQSEDAGK